MASVDSRSRRWLKPILKKFFGQRVYDWFHQRAKLRDIRLGLVEEPEMETLSWFVKPGDQVLDIGANFGYYTSRLSRLCGTGTVHAFEPVPTTFTALQGILKSMKLRNVEAHQVGVADTSGELVFEVPLQEAGTPSAGQAHISGRNNSLEGGKALYSFHRSVQVRAPVVALDDPQWAARFSALSFVKIDIEGAELLAIRGMRNLLRQHKPVMLIEVCPFFLEGFQIAPEELRAQIEELGYRTYRYVPASRILEELQPGSPYEEGNYILIHGERANGFASRISQEAACR